MAINRLKRHFGGAVLGEFYWPRPDITDPMLDTLRAGESLRQFGLRRTGKSSLLHEIERVLKSECYRPVYVNVEGHDGVGKLFSAVEAALSESDAHRKVTTAIAMTRSRVGQALEVWQHVKGQPSKTGSSPRAILHQIELIGGDLCTALAHQNRSIILLIDELPFLLKNMIEGGMNVGEVNGFLATLRSWRQEGQLPMLLAGSMGLSWLVRDWGVAREHFNDVIPFDAPPPLSDEDARAMLHALASEAKCSWMDDAFVDAVLEENAAHYPSFLQFAFGRLQSYRARSVADVNRIFANYIRPGLEEDFYKQFDTRLSRYRDVDRPVVRAILRCVNSTDNKTTERSDVDDVLVTHEAADRDGLLASLVEDGFLTVDTRQGTVGFSSQLVRTWCQSRAWGR
jgi:hypothetical protein